MPALPPLIALRNATMHSAWGSHRHIAALRGLPATVLPEAELWIGAHAKAPSIAQLPSGEEPLDALLQARGRAVLGEGLVRRFPEGLPFLLKLLAVERPLSIQVHPNDAQAAAGWREEQLRGADATARSFVDRKGKPELLAALLPTVVLCGFRAMAEVRAHLDAIGLPAGADTPGGCFTSWLGAATPDALARAAARLASSGPSAEAWALTRELLELHPTDPAALAPLFMNIATLDVGDAIVIDPGTAHAAVHGFGVEVMASSDNVVRVGLTEKHCDRDAFLRIARTEHAAPRILRAAEDGSGWATYATEHAEFELSSARVGAEVLEVQGFAALLSVRGSLVLHCQGIEQVLHPGEACLVTDGATATVSGAGLLYRCRVPVSP